MDRSPEARASLSASWPGNADGWRLVRMVLSRLILLGFGATCLFGLGGCRAVEAIFKVGVWFGVLIVVAIVAVVGGIAALLLKRK